MKNIENRIAKLLDTDVNNLKIIRQDENQYLVSTNKFKNYIYDECKDALLDMDSYNGIDRSSDQDKYLTDEEKTQYYLENQGLIGFAIRKINIIDGIEYEELRDVCILGFTKALSTFNKKAGIRFSTYSVKCMLNEMYYYLRKEQKKVKENISTEKKISTDSDGNSLTVGDLISDIEHNNGLSSEDKILQDELHKVIQECLSRLEDDEQFVIKKRYGLENEKPWTQSKIAEILDMSQANVSKLEKICLKKMRLILKKLKYEYDAKSKRLIPLKTEEYDSGAENKFNEMERNSKENVLLIVCEKLRLEITEVNEITHTSNPNEFEVSFVKNNRIYGIVNTITEKIELRTYPLTHDDKFMSFILHTPYLNIPTKNMIEHEEFNVVYSKEKLEEVISHLSETEQFVITNIYGLLGKKCKTVGQISEELKMSIQDVIDIKKTAYQKINQEYKKSNVV